VAEALSWLAGGRCCAVVSDINMPDMDGLQLLGEIKQRFPDLPVMMVTARGDDERRRQASEYGAAEFLTKPVDFERLKAQLWIARHPGSKLTAQSKDRLPPASGTRTTVAFGHEDASPPPRLGVRCRFNQGSSRGCGATGETRRVRSFTIH